MPVLKVWGVFHNVVYYVPIPLGYYNLNIVHLEMINILVAIKLFGNHWKEQGVRIYYDKSVYKSFNLAVLEIHIWLHVLGMCGFWLQNMI